MPRVLALLPPKLRGAIVALAGMVAIAVAAPGADIIILKDGTVLRGKMFKEKETVTDKLGQVRVVVDKARGFEGVTDTVKYTFFGTHSRQVGEKSTDDPAKIEPDKYFREAKVKTALPLPGGFGEIRTKAWDANWRRTMELKIGGGFDQIEQAVTYIDPNVLNVISTTHKWRQGYYTREWLPGEVLGLLATHPDLKEEAGKPDVVKRLKKITLLKDVGKTQADWLVLAKAELDKLKKDVAQPWPKDAAERADVLQAEIDKAAGNIRVVEMEHAIQSGRYSEAARIGNTFAVTTADPTDTARFTALNAQLETVGPRYSQAKALLRMAIDDVTGGEKIAGHIAVGGAAGWKQAPKPVLDEEMTLLVAGAEGVWAELHPDATTRVDLFLSLAAQAETKRKAGEPSQTKPENLLALAVTGWLKGKNGADQTVATGAKAWAAREMLMAYLREDISNRRGTILKNYISKGVGVPFDELAQIISLLPPTEAEYLAKPKAVAVPEATAGIKGILRYTVSPSIDLPKGVEYLLRLPDEYHHGRAYPMVMVLTHPTIPAEQAMARLAYEANRHGYILAAPLWVGVFDNKGAYDYSGRTHPLVIATRRDVLKKFQVDPDRVSLFGFAEGGNFAMDMGMSHPDLFAACTTFGANPKMQNMFREYWFNAQKLPMYSVTGEIAGSSFQNFYELYGDLLQHGFPSLLITYQGRGAEWYLAEMAPMFDWLDKRKRATGIATLRQAGLKQFEWRTMRKDDNRFYWVGATEIERVNLLENSPVKGVFPAGLKADIRNGNLISVEARGIKKVTIWLERNMIDWTQPVRVQVNSNAPSGYRAKVIEPSLEFMLDEFYRSGDRKMLFYNKLEFPAR